MFSCQAITWIVSILALGLGIMTVMLNRRLRAASIEIFDLKYAEKMRLQEHAQNKLSRSQRNRGNFLFNLIEEMLENTKNRFTVTRNPHSSGSYEILIKHQGKLVIDAHLTFDEDNKYLSVFGSNNGGIGQPVPGDANDEWFQHMAAWLLQQANEIVYGR